MYSHWNPRCYLEAAQALFFVIELWLVKPGLCQDLIIVSLLPEFSESVSLRTMGAMVLFRRSVLDKNPQTVIRVKHEP